MTNDELKQYLVAVEYEIGAGTPGADTTYALGEEVLQLRAELARLKPLADAAVRLARNLAEGENEPDDVIDLAHAAQSYARAQAQDGGK